MQGVYYSFNPTSLQVEYCMWSIQNERLCPSVSWWLNYNLAQNKRTNGSWSSHYSCKISNQACVISRYLITLQAHDIINSYDTLSYDNVSLDASRYAIKNRYDLVILEVIFEDAGEYKCDIGQGVSASAFLDVIGT